MATKPASGLSAVMQSMGGRILFVLINAGTGIITARALHPAGRGELAALGVWPNFLGSLMTLGLPSALIFWSRAEPENKSSLMWASLPLTIVLGLLAMLIGIAGSFIGTWIGRLVGWYQEGQSAGFIMSLIGALILLGIYHLYKRSTAS